MTIDSYATTPVPIVMPSRPISGGSDLPPLNLGKSLSQTRQEYTTSPMQFGELKVVMFINDQRVVVVPFVKAGATAEKSNVPTFPALLSTQLDQIKGRLGLSITQMAELFGVTRKAVYDWYDGADPRAVTTSRIECLLDVLSRCNNLDLMRLKTVWNIPLGGKSFKSVLNDDSLSADAIRTSLTTKLHELSSRMLATNLLPRKVTTYIGDAHTTDIDKHADIG